ncbi:MAG: hypothetical protein LUD68_05310, partial [Rikenellaceae bacterium]|nr:hypothetical protein [Rikenellaceae bacterium]
MWMCLGSGTAAGQPADPGFNGIISQLFALQQLSYPQEKVYVQLDRNHYIAGDTIWFRGHLVNAYTHEPDTSSRYLYVNLVNPADSLVRKLRIRRQQGAYPGYFSLPEDIPEGEYTVWAYTLAMLNAGQEYFFRTPVRITDPLSIRIGQQISLQREPGEKHLSADLRFRDLATGEPTRPNELKINLNQESPVPVWAPRRAESFSHTFRNPDTTRRNALLIDYDGWRRFVEVPPSPALFDVSFHPEGGYLIPGQMNT